MTREELNEETRKIVDSDAGLESKATAEIDLFRRFREDSGPAGPISVGAKCAIKGLADVTVTVTEIVDPGRVHVAQSGMETRLGMKVRVEGSDAVWDAGDLEVA